MRCTSCHSYIPEGLTSPATCPQCGSTVAETPASTATAPARSATPPPMASTSSTEAPFAPFFTIRTRFVFGVARTLSSGAPSEGSLSFGPEGFSLVWSEGERWEKFLYRDLADVRLDGDAISMNIRDVESKLEFFPRSSLFRKPSRNHALAFLDLMNKVRNGLSPAEVSVFRKQLE